jgi:cellulose synthase/poly-beta-1,6-N-acetylglucosamine synthase-like glycosyltransferase/glycosyltransferase involved in cell wall biosynthesis
MQAEGISIVVPTLNEEGNVKKLMTRVSSTLKPLQIPFEIIFIDDHSDDNTVETIKNLGQNITNIRWQLKNGRPGKAQSLLEGFDLARFDTIAMIDADLQYPPETIAPMYQKIKDGAGVVVASRSEKNMPWKRKLASRLFFLFFAKFLHGLDVDAQSGLKVFRKEIIQKIALNPTPWTFDLEFLLKSRAAAYKIEAVPIAFAPRKAGKSKVNLLATSFEIGWNALKLKFREIEAIPSTAGFYFGGHEFVHHSNLALKETAFKLSHRRQQQFILFVILALILSLLINWHLTLIVLTAGLTILYFLDLFFNLFLIHRAFAKSPEINVKDEDITRHDSSNWPTYTILCPLYREANVIRQFIDSMSTLDYPKDKLQVLLLLEEDDILTIDRAKEVSLPPFFEIVIVPHSLPKTKPKALNYGLKLARGEYLAVYDAEDKPEPTQLKKAVLAFERVSLKTVCIQAKLNFYNPRQNLLTRFFTAEYSVWFDLILTGLQSINAPIPLGGTSNHFRTTEIKKLKGWDSFNVTEDCDLGIRLARHGYQTAIINSTTYEEANSRPLNWLHQRTRWIKGYIQTYFVHTRNLKNSDPRFQLIVGGKVLSMFINPVMWLITISYFISRSTFGHFIESLFPGPVLYLGVLSFVAGNFLYLYYYMIGSAKRKQYDLIKFALLTPFYWLFMSLAAWRAVFQIIVKPHYWEKTEHGLHFPQVPRTFLTLPKIRSPAFNYAFFTISILIASVLNFAFNAVLGRALSFENFGLITLINAFLYFFSIPLSAIATTINHRISLLKNTLEEQDHFFQKTTRLFLRPAILITFLWMVASPFLTRVFHEKSSLIFIFFAPSFYFGTIESLNYGFLKGNNSFARVAWITIIEPMVKLTSAVAFLLLNLEPYVFLSIPLSVFVTAIFSKILIFHPQKISLTRQKHYRFPKKFFLASLASSVSTAMILSVDIILAKHFLSARAAGQYALISLTGKMIFFLGSIPSNFTITFVNQNLSRGINPSRAFHKIFGITTAICLLSVIFLGYFAPISLPLLFGRKAISFIPDIMPYVIGTAFLTLTNAIGIYELARKRYIFSVFSLIAAMIMATSIIFYHASVTQITQIIGLTGVITFVGFIITHYLLKHGWLFTRAITDLIDIFFPAEKISPKINFGKNILIFNWRDEKHVYAGGAETYIQEMATRWVKMGNSVTMFCGNDGKNKRNETIDGVQIFRRGGFYLVYLWAFIYYLLKFRGKFDLIIDSQNGLPFFTPLYVKEPIIGLLHHVHQEVFRKTLVFPFANIAGFMEKQGMPRVYRNLPFITVSQSSKEAMEKLPLKGKIFVAPPGVNLANLIPREKSQNPLVLYLGRLKAYKSIPVLINAFKKVLDELPSCRLIIAGDGEEKAFLEKLTSKLNLTPNIEFKGHVTEHEKISLLQQAWVLVNPSMMEGWGITTIEANACGTPVIASNVPGLRDSVRNPSTGFLVSYGQTDAFAGKISLILKNQELRKKLAQKSRIWAENFDWDLLAKNSWEKIMHVVENNYEKTKTNSYDWYPRI